MKNPLPARSRLLAPWLLLAGFAACGAVAADNKPLDYPTRTVKLVTLAGAGSQIDATARMLAEGLARKWGVAVIVENKVGASGMIATEFVAKSAPDGYTVLVTTQTPHIYNPLLRKTTYDPFADFQPVSELVRGPIALIATKNYPANNVNELVAMAQKDAQAVSFGTWGIGSGAHLLGEQLKKQGNINLIHVPYKNAETAILQDLLAGSLNVGFLTAATAKAQAQNGAVKILAVTGDRRSAQLPNVPTFKEQGFNGMEFGGWISAFVPARVSADIVKKLEADMRHVILDPATVKRLSSMTFDAVGSSAKELATTHRKEYDHWATLLKTIKIDLE